ncbi:MAG: efflux RND transporter periplasmic adaptor subunit [Verrucomicrobia bacterium]|nr:efflux RND transporter periplasmic adaptor subunit [Verrucomicrobiota bacterium]
MWLGQRKCDVSEASSRCSLRKTQSEDASLTSIFLATLRFAAGGLVLPVVLALSACHKEKETEPPEVRPVRTIIVEKQPAGETVVLTGHIEAENEAALGFRIPGRMIERLVNVGDRVKPGQLLARLDPQDEENGLRSARANLAAAEGQLTQARNNFERQRRLLERGVASRADFDHAQEGLQTAQARVDDAEAQLKLAGDRLSFTELKADAAGTVTARGAEAGEVVQAGQMIVRIARQDGRDAVFDFPAQLLRSAPPDAEITVHLAEDPSVTAIGRVREVGEQADPVTRTFQVKVGLTDPPPSMRLGSTVNGSVQLNSAPVISIPASALTRINQQPAVWIVDPSKLTVSLRNIEVSRYDPGTVVVGQGLDTGDIVVTAGVQALHPGQKVRLLPQTS